MPVFVVAAVLDVPETDAAIAEVEPVATLGFANSDAGTPATDVPVEGVPDAALDGAGCPAERRIGATHDEALLDAELGVDPPAGATPFDVVPAAAPLDVVAELTFSELAARKIGAVELDVPELPAGDWAAAGA